MSGEKMNFQAIDAVKDQQDGKGYPVKINVLATPVEITGMGQKNGKSWQTIKLRDNTGTQHKVWLQGKDFLQPAHLNQQLSFSIGCRSGMNNGTPYTSYSGFWNQAANTNPTAPYIPPAQNLLANMPSDKFGAKSSPQSSDKDWQICRQCCIKAAAEYCGNAVAPDSVIDVAELWAQYCMTGKIEQPQNGEDAPDDSELPF
jgi:hypothetical protein